MKLATIKNGSRDGRLAIVSKDLTRAVYADAIADTHQCHRELGLVEKPLRMRSEKPRGWRRGRRLPFDPAQAMSPLPRCYQWLDGSTFRQSLAP